MTPAWTPQIVKEVRALLPVWAVCVAAVLLTAGRGSYAGLDMAEGVYAFGCLGLGALSIGSEYNHRTLAMLLAQPIGRGRILALKLLVLVPMLLSLAAALLVNDTPPWRTLVLPLLCSLTLTPWLTLICRGPLAGLVFSVAVPAVLGVGLMVIARVGSRGLLNPPVFPMSMLRWSSLTCAAVAGAVAWRRFMHLEVVDDSGPVVMRLPIWSTVRRTETIRPRTQPQHWWLQLVKKELRLQQLSLAVAGIFICFWVSVVVLNHTIKDFDGPPIIAFAYLHGLLQMLLIGSLASADERQLGTIEWQTLFPIAAWKQWAVKVAAVWSLALLFAVGLPALLGSIAPVGESLHIRVVVVLAVWAGSSVSLYISSLNSTGIRAVLVSIPTLFVSVLILGAVGDAVENQALRHISRPPRIWPFNDVPTARAVTIGLPLMLMGSVIFLLLRFAMLNHGSAERSARRVWRQALVLGCSLVTGLSLSLIVVTIFRFRYR